MSLHAGSIVLRELWLPRFSADHGMVSDRIAPDGATEDGVVIPVSNGVICSLLQDRCW